MGNRRSWRMVWIVALTMTASACSNVETLRKRAPAGEDFASRLAAEYLAYSESEQEQKHRATAEYFAGKGLQAATGHVPDPEKPALNRLVTHEYRLLEEAYQRLLAVLTAPAREKLPESLARAQLLYDCWYAEVVLRRLKAEEAPCGTEFEAAMQEVEHELLAQGLATVGQQEAAQLALAFPRGGTQLSKAALAKLSRLAVRAKSLPDYRVRVTGYADASGSTARSRHMAEARAERVRQALVRRGIEDRRIVARGGGLSAPVEIGASDLPPRRVEVVLYTLKPVKK